MIRPFEWAVHASRPIDATLARTVRAGGVHAVVVGIPWPWTEEREGGWETRGLDRLLRPLLDAGLSVIGLLGPAMPHALPAWLPSVDAPGFAEKFASWCGRAAAALPEISAFRVEDELNAAANWERWVTRRRRGNRWADPGFRAGLLAGAVSAVRAARPDADLRTTLRTDLPGWRAEVARFVAAGVVLDEWSVSVAPGFLLPDPALASACGEAVEGLRAATPTAARVGVGRIGYPTVGPRRTHARQREFLRIAAASARAAGACGLTWQTLRDQAYDDPGLGYRAARRDRHAGLMRYDGTPKVAWDEFRALSTGDRLGGG